VWPDDFDGMVKARRHGAALQAPKVEYMAQCEIEGDKWLRSTEA